MRERAAWMLERRATLGLTQDQVAEGCGVSQSVVSRWEEAARMMGGHSARRLEAYFASVEKRQQAARRAAVARPSAAMSVGGAR